jgi:GT2 family glycosyltransferase
MGKSKTSIGVVITCHNRKEKTLASLKKLINQDNIDKIDLNIYLADDGSTDGTSEAVKKNFPQVNIIKGDGTLYWNGGMRVAFSKAIRNKHDYYLWLNDDTILYRNALKLLVTNSINLKQKQGNDVIVTGSIKDIDTGAINYGGRNQKSKLQPLFFTLLNSSAELQKCNTFNGNVVLIPQNVVSKIGNISPEFSKQHGGDIDYGLRAKYEGFESWVAPGVVGECPSNSLKGTIFDKSLPLRDRIKQMKSPKGVPPAREWMVFAKRHAGFLWPFYWLRTMVRIIFPWAYLLIRKPQ